MSTTNEILSSLRDLHSIARDLQSKATRTETKLVRGFEELGVNISTGDDWLTVDDVERTVTVTTLGRSTLVMLTDMARRGATQVGKEYTVLHRGRVAGSVVFTPPR